MSSCCCECEKPIHRRGGYGEECALCGKHRPSGGPVNFVPDDWEDKYDKMAWEMTGCWERGVVNRRIAVALRLQHEVGRLEMGIEVAEGISAVDPSFRKKWKKLKK